MEMMENDDVEDLQDGYHDDFDVEVNDDDDDDDDDGVGEYAGTRPGGSAGHPEANGETAATSAGEMERAWSAAASRRKNGSGSDIWPSPSEKRGKTTKKTGGSEEGEEEEREENGGGFLSPAATSEDRETEFGIQARDF